MFFSTIELSLTQDEKIDYIYQELKREESHRRWSKVWTWIWRIFLIASTFWLYLHPEAISNMLKMPELAGMGGPNAATLQSLTK